MLKPHVLRKLPKWVKKWADGDTVVLGDSSESDQHNRVRSRDIPPTLAGVEESTFKGRWLPLATAYNHVHLDWTGHVYYQITGDHRALKRHAPNVYAAIHKEGMLLDNSRKAKAKRKKQAERDARRRKERLRCLNPNHRGYL